MNNRYPGTPDVKQYLDGLETDKNVQAPDGNAIRKSIPIKVQDKNPKAVPVSYESRNSASESISEEALQRLQQAAHILATGAIRAAQKQKAARQKSAQKASKSMDWAASDNQTLPNKPCDMTHKEPAKRAPKGLKTSTSDKRKQPQG